MFDTIVPIGWGGYTDVKAVLLAFDEFLAAKGQSFSATIVGGAALNLLAVTSRVTRDVDVMDPGALPKEIENYAREFALLKEFPKIGSIPVLQIS